MIRVTTHNDGTVFNNPVRTRGYPGRLGIGIEYRTLTMLHHNRNYGTENGDSDQDGNDDDKRKSPYEPTRLISVPVGGEDGE